MHRHGGPMVALTVDEYQYLVGAHSAQLWRTDEGRAVVDRVTLHLK